MPFLEENMSDPSYRVKHRLLTRLPLLIPIIAAAAAPLRLAPMRVRRLLLGSQLSGMEEEV